MIDVQQQKDTRRVYLNEVGIKDLTFPIEIKNKDGKWQTTHAKISLSVDLDPEQRGTHMSRFVDIIQENNRIDLNHIKNILSIIQEKLGATKSFIELQFEYFIKKEAPVSKKISYINVGVNYKAWLDKELEFEMTVITPVTTLCPCSKEISEASAHNQRGNVSITVKSNEFIWIEDLVKISEDSASSPLYALLKRPDEKYVTEYAYNNPRFVEDVCREVKLKLEKENISKKYEILVESFESIHNHNAFAKIISEDMN
ncbi:GTP cyclohydrolase FolE2 [Miniphocaeibacter massiliensis]|uniref:GTP cyclohydrolase FolE2 n=1 Tax=Miniphocaeibacter massiliensis TaxID=2041841 RepID=UPI000C1C42D3|nr:GTP cyclohydrolase FolE2 [Miniphocaeibacter massiliensis]